MLGLTRNRKQVEAATQRQIAAREALIAQDCKQAAPAPPVKPAALPPRDSFRTGQPVPQGR